MNAKDLINRKIIGVKKFSDGSFGIDLDDGRLLILDMCEEVDE
jgi:hypothetical protein